MSPGLPTRRGELEGDALLQASPVLLFTADVGMQHVLTASVVFNKVCTNPKCYMENLVCYACSTETWSFPYFLGNKLHFPAVHVLRAKNAHFSLALYARGSISYML